jgi:His/Glu/Gln/Arg/opine family amino acid ABC transporter permease subunit
MAFDPNVVVSALPWLLRGAQLTLSSSLLAIVLGVMVGIALTLALHTGIRPVQALVWLYISFARGTPLFIQILIVFYILPSIGLDISSFLAGVIALSLNSGAYVSEMIRGGLSAIPKGQVEAARAIGMRRSLIWRRITLPQVFTLILPPLTVEFTALLKASALLSVIGVVELTRTAQQIVAATFKPIEIWLTVGVLYFFMCFALAALTRRLERVTMVYRLN